MPKGNATFMAQWLRIENNVVVVYRTGLMSSGSATESVEEAVEKLEKGEIVYLDPFDALLKDVQLEWTIKHDLLKLNPLSPAPSEKEQEFAESLQQQLGSGNISKRKGTG